MSVFIPTACLWPTGKLQSVICLQVDRNLLFSSSLAPALTSKHVTTLCLDLRQGGSVGSAACVCLSAEVTLYWPCLPLSNYIFIKKSLCVLCAFVHLIHLIKKYLIFSCLLQKVMQNPNYDITPAQGSDACISITHLLVDKNIFIKAKNNIKSQWNLAHVLYSVYIPKL